MSYDPEARRDTPLALKIKQRIRERGPMPVSEFMAACLQDPEHGYYRTRQAIGRDGDFITAPEISQIFGELIGLWAVVVWQQMGEPRRFSLIEFGPGRGTLMADALRAARLAPGFLDAAHIVLIETNGALRSWQRQALAAHTGHIEWACDLEEVSRLDIGRDRRSGLDERPAIVIGNEFLDCHARGQYVRCGNGWLLRGVGLDERDRLVFRSGGCWPGADFLPGSGRQSSLDVQFPNAAEGDVIEHGLYDLFALGTTTLPTFAALLLDYGYETPRVGDTLQAVRNHNYEHPLTSPGEADLTMHVDFSAVQSGVTGINGVFDLAHGSLAVDGPVTQAEFLGALGIAERASRLMAANPAHAGTIEQAVARLMSPTGMGGRFKAIGLRTASLPPLPGLTPSRRR